MAGQPRVDSRPPRARPVAASLLAAALFLGGTSAPASAQPRGNPLIGLTPAGPAGALWVTRASLRDEADAERVLRTAQTLGVKLLLVQAVGRGDATYASHVLPSAEGMGAFDALAYLAPRARDRGILVHAWVNALLAWSSYVPPEDPRHWVRSRPAWLLSSSGFGFSRNWDPGRYPQLLREGVYLEPAKREVRRTLQEIVKEIILRYEVQGVVLDYLEYPAHAQAADVEARTRFRRAYYADPPDLSGAQWPAHDREALLWGTLYPDNDPELRELGEEILEPAPDVTETPADILPSIRDPELPFPLDTEGTAVERDRRRDLYRRWVLWRAEQVTETLREMREEIHRWRPEVFVGAAVLPDIAHARNVHGQDWTAWVREGLVDYVAPKFFVPNTNLAADQMRNVSAAVGSAPVLASVAVWNQPPEAAAAKIRVAREQGFGPVAIFAHEALLSRRNWWSALRARLE